VSSFATKILSIEQEYITSIEHTAAVTIK